MTLWLKRGIQVAQNQRAANVHDTIHPSCDFGPIACFMANLVSKNDCFWQVLPQSPYKYRIHTILSHRCVEWWLCFVHNW